jgi:hypothetical protein
MTTVPRIVTALSLCFALVAPAAAQRTHAPAAPPRHNVILFVPDGLRGAMVDGTIAPTMDAVRRNGVTFSNSHSIFPTFTTANASTMATGHLLGDTGDFSNTIFTGYKVAAANLSFTPFLESDPVIADVDEHFAGNYLDAETILMAAAANGYATAAIGKLGPTAIFDAPDTQGRRTLVIDDQTGHLMADNVTPAGRPLPASVISALKAQLGTAIAPGRGDNGNSGDARKPGTLSDNAMQQSWFVDAATDVVMPALRATGKPFVMVFWSRDPDGTQHNQGDSLGSVTPGINGPTSLSAIKNADDDLRRLREALRAQGLEATTDIIISSDHGFSTISKTSKTATSAAYELNGVNAGELPPGFLALDLAHLLDLPLSDPDNDDVSVQPELEHKFPSHGNGLIGHSVTKPDVVIASNGGSDLIYLPSADGAASAARIIAFLLAQDYVSGLFVDARLGTFAGTLPLDAINLQGSAVTPHPAIVVNFRSYATGCAEPLRCTAEIADTTLQQGQGMHGSFSRADTGNFTAAIGPDFRRGFVDTAPVSNADVGQTIAALLHLRLHAHGSLIGRPFREAFVGGRMPIVTRGEQRSTADANGNVTVIRWQRADGERYIDAAGKPGTTVGL